MVNVWIKISAEELGNLDPSVRLVVIHPDFRQGHLIFADFLREALPVVYVRFDGKNLAQDQLRVHLDMALSRQRGTVRLDDVEILVLDECDHADPQGLPEFLKSVIAPNRRVIVLSRLVPWGVLNDTTLRQQTVFLPKDSTLMLTDYAHRDNGTALLEVCAFGRGRVVLNGREIRNWDGVLPRSLFFFLVDRAITTRDEIFATFWPNLSTREATNVFHVTKRKINEILDMDLTTYSSSYYRISPDIELNYDARQFTELAQNAASAEAIDAGNLLRQATALYRGHFLTSLEVEWVHRRRAELRQLYADTLAGLGRLGESQQDHHQALGYYIRAISAYPRRQDLAEQVMQTFRRLGMHQDALMLFERLEAWLGTIDVPLSPELKQVADQIRTELVGDS